MSDNNATRETPNRLKRKSAYRARHRLLSIDKDAASLAQQQLAPSILPHAQKWPWIPNKQCGSWYLPATSSYTPVYFKSTDGHLGTYAFSLKRLNLQLIEILHDFGGCHLVDSSVRKILPDSFSRTIPIWCCVLNRIILRYREELNSGKVDNGQWDTQLYTPASIVSAEEHALISNLIDSRVQLLYDSKAIVDPRRLIKLLNRPLRARWCANGRLENDTPIDATECVSIKDEEYYTIVCYNPSSYTESKSNIQWISTENSDDDEKGYFYTPGAADDDATWGKGLTPQLFWSNKEHLLNFELCDNEVDNLISTLVKNNVHEGGACVDGNIHDPPTHFMDKIGNLNLWIGSRKAGKPPECWEHVDVILNVTDMEYPTMMQSIINNMKTLQRQCFYAMLPVAEGKKDKTQLEKWMPVGLYFLIHHLQCGRRVLVHCAQGRDRSVAMVLALVVLICPLEYPLKLRQDFDMLDLSSLQMLAKEECASKMNEDEIYLQSGLLLHTVNALLEVNGSEIFLKWVHQYAKSQCPLANKHSLRIALHLIQQDREVAEPTRLTMQKLNRFFMSSSLYRSIS